MAVESKPLLGKDLVEVLQRVANGGEQFANSVRNMQDCKTRLINQMRYARNGGVDNVMLRSLLPGMTDAAVEDLLAEPPKRVVKAAKKKPKGK